MLLTHGFVNMNNTLFHYLQYNLHEDLQQYFMANLHQKLFKAAPKSNCGSVQPFLLKHISSFVQSKIAVVSSISKNVSSSQVMDNSIPPERKSFASVKHNLPSQILNSNNGAINFDIAADQLSSGSQGVNSLSFSVGPVNDVDNLKRRPASFIDNLRRRHPYFNKGFDITR